MLLRERLRHIKVPVCNEEVTAEAVVDALTGAELSGQLESAAEELRQNGRLAAAEPTSGAADKRSPAPRWKVSMKLPMYTLEQLQTLLRQGRVNVDSVLTICASGCSTWAEQGVHVSDALGYVVIPEFFDLAKDAIETRRKK